MSVTDIGLSWSKAEILVTLGIGRTFAVFQILGTCWETWETFKICVLSQVLASGHTPSKTKKAGHLGQWQSFSIPFLFLLDRRCFNKGDIKEGSFDDIFTRLEGKLFLNFSWTVQ